MTLNYFFGNTSALVESDLLKNRTQRCKLDEREKRYLKKRRRTCPDARNIKPNQRVYVYAPLSPLTQCFSITNEHTRGRYFSLFLRTPKSSAALMANIDRQTDTNFTHRAKFFPFTPAYFASTLYRLHSCGCWIFFGCQQWFCL